MSHDQPWAVFRTPYSLADLKASSSFMYVRIRFNCVPCFQRIHYRLQNEPQSVALSNGFEIFTLKIERKNDESLNWTAAWCLRDKMFLAFVSFSSEMFLWLILKVPMTHIQQLQQFLSGLIVTTQRILYFFNSKPLSMLKPMQVICFLRISFNNCKWGHDFNLPIQAAIKRLLFFERPLIFNVLSRNQFQ